MRILNVNLKTSTFFLIETRKKSLIQDIPCTRSVYTYGYKMDLYHDQCIVAIGKKITLIILIKHYVESNLCFR